MATTRKTKSAAQAVGKHRRFPGAKKRKRRPKAAASAAVVNGGAHDATQGVIERIGQSKREILGGDLERGMALGREWVNQRADYAVLKAFIERDWVGEFPAVDQIQLVQLIGNRTVIRLWELFRDGRSRHDLLTGMFTSKYRELSDTLVRGFVQGAVNAYREVEGELDKITAS